MAWGWLGGAGAGEELPEVRAKAHCAHRGVEFDVLLRSASGDEDGDDMSIWMVPAGRRGERVELEGNWHWYGFDRGPEGAESVCDKTLAFPISKRRVAVLLWVRGDPANERLAALIFDTGRRKVVAKSGDLGPTNQPFKAEPHRGGFIFESCEIGQPAADCGDAPYSSEACPRVHGRVPRMIMNYMLANWRRVVLRGGKLAVLVDPLITYQRSRLKKYFQNAGAFRRAFEFKAKSGRFENFGYILATFEDGTELLYDPRLRYDPENLEDRNWIEPR